METFVVQPFLDKSLYFKRRCLDLNPLVLNQSDQKQPLNIDGEMSSRT